MQALTVRPGTPDSADLREAAADDDWLAGLVTRRVPLARWSAALPRHGDDMKVVLEFGG
ncbi:hypothetical protein ACU610_07630 [Geodermatophilus sp. URMC 61]|uniref:hypothetical protein n=1 Tax=Geodermatophilus sp. URMC 61 TaxID=3423411 RepID=UPI00406D4903